MRIFPNQMLPQRKSKAERGFCRVIRSLPAFEADLDPFSRRPRLRFNFHNGWTGSLVMQTAPLEGAESMTASVAAWPTGQQEDALTERGPTDASADEALNWLDDIRSRDVLA